MPQERREDTTKLTTNTAKNARLSDLLNSSWKTKKVISIEREDPSPPDTQLRGAWVRNY